MRASVKSAGTGAHCVAVDLGATTVRAIEIEWTHAAGQDTVPRILRRGSAPLPHHAWSDLSVNRDAIAVAIKEALAAGGITAKTVVASLPRRLVTLRFARLPHAPPDQMRSMVAFEAQQYILFSLDEVILDYHVLPEALPQLGGGDDMETVLLAAARRSLISDLVSAFDKAGLELQLLTVSALALAEHIRDALEPTALIDLEPGEMDVAVVADGQILFTRATALDGLEAPPDVAGRRLAEEVARSFTAYMNEFRHRPLAHIYLAGESVVGTGPDTLERTVSETLEMPVSRMHSRLLSTNDPESFAYATALGAALQTQPNSLAPINLVPSERMERKRQVARRQQHTLLGTIAFALVVVSIFMIQSALKQRNRILQETIQANGDLHTITTRMDSEKKVHAKLSAVSNDLDTGLDRNHPMVDVLAALSSALPKSVDIWLTQFSFERGKLITLHGETKSARAATDLVLALQRSGAFSDVRLSYMGDSQDTNVPGVIPSVARPAPTGGATSSGNTSPVTPLPGMSSPPAPGAGAVSSPSATRTPSSSGDMPMRRRTAPFDSPVPTSPPNMPPFPTSPPSATPGAPSFSITPSRPPGAPPQGGPVSVPGGGEQQGGLERVRPGQNTVTKPLVGSSISVTPQQTTNRANRTSGANRNKATVKTTARPERATLTSFTITCRINKRAKNLLPVGATVATSTDNSATKVALPKTRQRMSDSEPDLEEGSILDDGESH